MQKSKNAFTMIELIFVIVILGILAAVAIPKLSATRYDAEFSKAEADAATCLMDIVSSYTATATATIDSMACTADNVTPVAGATDATATNTLTGGSTFTATDYKGTSVAY